MSDSDFETMEEDQLRRMALERPNRDMQLTYPILLAIDPSINNLGYAMFDMGHGAGNQYDLTSGAWIYGLIHPKGKYIQHKWRDTFRQLLDRLDKRPTHFASEWPTFFTGQRGMIAAQMGYTIDLAGIVGYLAGRFAVRADWIALWTPQQWKGSVPKHITERKFVRLFGDGAKKAIRRGISNDEIDAVMIAEFWLSLYNRDKFSWQHKKETVSYET
jgi:hypothetical protein